MLGTRHHRSSLLWVWTSDLHLANTREVSARQPRDQGGCARAFSLVLLVQARRAAEREEARKRQIAAKEGFMTLLEECAGERGGQSPVT